jgi:hypothetical protein
MKRSALTLTLVAASAILASCASTPAAGPMSFFVTSSNPGKGGDLGGLAGADAYCQKLATDVGAGARTWRAYLSTPAKPAPGATPWGAAVDARDRIGSGPWFNAKGVLIAKDVAHLHNGNHINKSTALDEKGNVVSGRGDAVNNHDMLTGSRADGTAFAPQTDTTCGSWTKSGEGSAIVGHHDLIGPTADAWSKSWNFSHQTQACSMEAFRRTGGAGQFYCFAAK